MNSNGAIWETSRTSNCVLGLFKLQTGKDTGLNMLKSAQVFESDVVVLFTRYKSSFLLASSIQEICVSSKEYEKEIKQCNANNFQLFNKYFVKNSID